MVKEGAASSTRDSSIKKRRKTGGSNDPDSEIDLYKKVIAFEEQEAFKRSADADSKLYSQICKSIQNILEEILELKPSKSPENVAKISEKIVNAAALVITLKKLNRLEKVRSTSAREALNTEKQKVDSINLQYQNLLYESDHLLSDYKKCKQFKSKDEDIHLISIDEFLKEAPEEKTKPFKNVTELNDTQKHELHLARLEWELTQRKKLAELCNSFEEEKKLVGADIIKTRNRLTGLAPKLGLVLDSTKPLQEYLGSAVEKTYADHKLAALLPNPLYLLYAYADAYQNVHSIELNVNICGDQDEAYQWKQIQNTDEPEDESDAENDQQEGEENITVTKRHRRIMSHVDRQEEKRKRLFQSHPLSVQISIKIKDGPSININFCYRTTLNIVTVTSNVSCPSTITGNIAREVLSAENILGELFEGDVGTLSPNPSNTYQLQKIGVTSYETIVSTLGYAYSWAQKVCGLDFLKPLTNKGMAEIGCKNVEYVIKALDRRLKSRTALAIQLQQLEQNILPTLPPSIIVSQKSSTSITKWSSATWEEFYKSPGTTELVHCELVTPNDLFYFVVITRAKQALLNAFVCIKNDYPKQWPIFSITIKHNGEYHSGNSEEIRDMERAVNIASDDNLVDPKHLLTIQLYRLCGLFDVYLEVTSPTSFPQTVGFFKSICARNRRHPYRFRKMGAGMFTQF